MPSFGVPRPSRRSKATPAARFREGGGAPRCPRPQARAYVHTGDLVSARSWCDVAWGSLLRPALTVVLGDRHRATFGVSWPSRFQFRVQRPWARPCDATALPIRIRGLSAHFSLDFARFTDSLRAEGPWSIRFKPKLG